MPHRFFVTADRIAGGVVSFRPEQAHQIARVLRLRPGDEVLVLDNGGLCHRAALRSITPKAAEAAILDSAPATGEPETRVVLWQGLLKGEKWEWVLQKGTEIGVSAFIPALCHRDVARYERDAWAGRSERWRRVIQEAAEQSGRGKLPELGSPTEWEEACRAAGAAGIVLYEGERETSLRRALDALARRDAVHLLAGPEGGLTEEEVEAARSHGLLTATLGPRILRAETAGPVAAALVLYHFGEM